MPILLTMDVPALKAAAKRAVDDAAEQRRLVFITPGSGQAMVYTAKQEEARRYNAEQPADLTGYPLLAAEVGISAPTAADLVALWLSMETLWLTTAAAIEAARFTGKNAIDAATTPAAIEAAKVSALAAIAAVGAS